MKRMLVWPLLLGMALVSNGCTPRFGPFEVQGRPAMVGDRQQQRLWVLTKQEEVRRVGAVGRRAGLWPDATLYHFRVQAFDPVTARPLWSRHLLTLGNPNPTMRRKVVGSAASGRLLGQADGLVWLVVDDKPRALAMSDGAPMADAATIEQRNPHLKGLLPVDGGHFAFDRGLVFVSADAQRFVIRDATLHAEPYVPRTPLAPPTERKANGMPVIVPTPPYGEIPARQVMLGTRWLGLYSPKEARDAGDDPTGMHLRWPYTVLDEGALARRTFWRGTIVEASRWDERFQRLDALAPIAGAPTFLKGRFLKDLSTGKPLRLESPDGFAVWHSTRIDRDGRLALTRLDGDLRTRWSAELPLGESGTANPVMYWLLPGRLVAMGDLMTQVEGTTRRFPHVVSLSLADGRRAAWNVADDRPAP